MENNDKILNEIKEISPLLFKLRNKNPYSVSFSYFGNLADTIAEKIKYGAEPVYYFTRENPYFTPDGYFQNLSASIIHTIKQDKTNNEVFEEMEAISPFLNQISKKPVYTVPADYLEKVKWNKDAVTVTKAKVISFVRSKKIVQFAAAAVITGMLAIGSFLFTEKENRNTQEYKVQATAEVKKLSEQEIVDFLKTTSPSDDIVSVTNSTNTKDNDIKSSVSKMSDNEIQQFLQENGEQEEM